MGAAAVLHVVCLLALMAALLTVVARKESHWTGTGTGTHANRSETRLDAKRLDAKLDARLDADDAEARWPGLIAKLRSVDMPAAAAKCNCGVAFG
jgi:hypothetical protein